MMAPPACTHNASTEPIPTASGSPYLTGRPNRKHLGEVAEFGGEDYRSADGRDWQEPARVPVLRGVIAGVLAVLAPQQHRSEQEQDTGNRVNRAVRQQPDQAPGGDRERYMHRERCGGTGEHEGAPVPAAHDQTGQHGLILAVRQAARSGRMFRRQLDSLKGTHQVGPPLGPGASGTAVRHCGRRSDSDPNRWLI